MGPYAATFSLMFNYFPPVFLVCPITLQCGAMVLRPSPGMDNPWASKHQKAPRGLAAWIPNRLWAWKSRISDLTDFDKAGSVYFV